MYISKRNNLFLLSTLPLALATGCAALSNGGDDDASSSNDASGTEDGTTTGGGQSMSIYDVQMGVEAGTVSDGDAVSITEVVVTSAIVERDGEETVYVQESEGGEWSGIAVFAPTGFGTELSVGDIVTFSGSVSEFFDQTQIRLNAGSDLSVVGSGDPLAPAVVTAAEVATGGAKAENYESVFVRVENVTCTAEADMFGQFQVEDALLVDDYFLVAAQVPSIEPMVGDAFARIDGVMTYNFDEFKLAPRTADDVDGGSGDGDGDTTGDGDSTGGSEVSIYDVQMGSVGVGSSVVITDVIVTSPTDPDGETFFVQDSMGGEYSGISVFVQDPTGLSVSPGDQVTISGTYEEYFELSQIQVASAADVMVTGTASVPSPAVVAAGDVATMGSAQENWEGVLVTVENVTVTDDALGFGDFLVTDSLRVDDYFFPAMSFTVPANGTVYTSITGVMSYAFDDARLLPRDASDLVAQ